MEEVANLDCWATLTGAKAVAELARRVIAAAISFIVVVCSVQCSPRSLADVR